MGEINGLLRGMAVAEKIGHPVPRLSRCGQSSDIFRCFDMSYDMWLACFLLVVL